MPASWISAIAAAHQLGAKLRVIALRVSADGLQLGVLGGHEQLEQEPAVVLLEPVAEALQLGQLLAVRLGVAVGVVAHEHLREVGVEALDVRPEVIAVLEIEHLLTGALGGHRELQSPLARLARHGRAELLIHQHAGHRRVGPCADGLQQALEDEVLGVGDDRRLLGIWLALDAEELLLKRAAVVEGENVELVVVAEFHGLSIAKVHWRRAAGPASAVAAGRARVQQAGRGTLADTRRPDRAERKGEVHRIG